MTSTEPAQADNILVTEGLSKSFGGLQAVADVNLTVRRNSIHALIGPNGAGKTTFFNLLTKFHNPTSGRILYEGKDITQMTPVEIARLRIVRSFQISAVFPTMTALENVRIALQRRLHGASFDFWRSNRSLRALEPIAEELLEQVGLGAFPDARAGDLPYGRKRALEIATTLALEPRLLLLDEPMAGMGQEDIARTSELIRKLARNRTVLMVEHNLSVVASLSDTITVLTRGRVLAAGDYKTISRNSEVIEAYIGVPHE